MKKVIVVSKTHLDLGFTDYAEDIKRKYLDFFIPNAIKTAEECNSDKKNFVWTTGSWLIKEALNDENKENAERLREALKRGEIAAHALPFTLHTELLDRDTLEYGLSLIDITDEITGKKTTAAKMTDVPGHTKALVPLLADKGIKLLHIGVNGASAIPKVPECFLWRAYGKEIVVIYSGEYGGTFKSEYTDDILYFDHTLDNHGAGGAKAVKKNLEKIQRLYPDYEVTAGTLSDYANEIWEVRDKLPIITSEIGDTWIHGSAADPYKSGALRTLIRLKNKWLSEGSVKKGGKEYKNLCDCMICIAEHTCGMDVKIALHEYKNYLKKDFQKAKAKHKRYDRIEKSWAEQREYINKAISALSSEHREEAEKELKRLIPNDMFPTLENSAETENDFTFLNSRMKLNKYGAVEHLSFGDKTVIDGNDKPCISYDSLGYEDYDYWFSHYSRDLNKTKNWAYADFGKPNIKKIADKYPRGRFFYKAEKISFEKNDEYTAVLVMLSTDKVLSRDLGAPREMQIRYTLNESKLTAEVLWRKKDANRLPECISFHLYPSSEKIEFIKAGEKINPYDIAENGGRKLSAVQKICCDGFEITNESSPLVSIGGGDILHFDNEYHPLSDGLSYILCDNIWGTNFPLWYSDNAYFKFTISKSE